MFMDTCTSPRSASSNPFARTAGNPPSLSRMDLAIRFAMPTSVVRRFTFQAMRTGRAPTMHADPLHGLLRTSDRGLGDTSAIANERDYGAIVVRVHLLIKDSDPGDGADGLRDCVDDILAAALGEIGDALDDLRHGGPMEATNVRVH